MTLSQEGGREVVGDGARVRRRQFLAAGAGAVTAGVVASTLPAGCAGRSDGSGVVVGPGSVRIELTVNGSRRTVDVEPRVTLVDALRERLDLTGTKKGCDRGECGACTVLVDDTRVLSCSTLAVMAQGRSITTIEGLAPRDRLHPLQAAFIRHDALQCGYCTPGQLMSAAALLRERGPVPLSQDDIREAMSGNLCRCSCYPNIVAAIDEVAAGARR